MTQGNVKFIASIFAITAAAACGQAPGDAGIPPNEPAVAESAKLLASISLEEGHVVDFYRAEHGFVFASETGRSSGSAPRLAAPENDGKSFVQIYRALAPTSAVPGALLDAEAQQDAIVDKIAYPPADGVNHGRGPAFYTSGEQAWFKQTFCPGAVKCLQFWDWIDSGWDYTTSWKSTALVGSEGPVPASHQALYWSCAGGPCRWVSFFASSVSPGTYHWISSGGRFYFKSTLTGAGANTQVSMSINDAPYGCAVCNDHSCQCGYMDSANLCADHGGVTAGLGCIQQP